jgi:3-oxoacyl-[acyl-carrier protein] reductase
MDLTGRVALVTGAGRGIGHAIATRLAAAGAMVAVNDRKLEKAQSVACELVALGGQAIGVAADVTSAGDVAGMVEEIITAYGHLDILINNAGITSDQLLLRMSEEEWDRVLTVDLKSVFLCSRASLKPMIKARWGRIINMSSVVGLMGNAGQTNYAAAKAGIIGFTRSLAKEVASRGITVNAIAPGFIETDMTARMSEKQRQEITGQIPLGCLGLPQDVADLAAFLASTEARYITGQVIAVDGGLHGS